MPNEPQHQQPQHSVPPVPPPLPPAAHGQPAQPGVYRENPGQNYGIIGLILNAVGVNIGGIILGIMSRNESRKVGMSTTIGTVSLVWGIIATALVALWLVFSILMFFLAIAAQPAHRTNTYQEPTSSPTQSTQNSLFN